jgi:hypothetical protein
MSPQSDKAPEQPTQLSKKELFASKYVGALPKCPNCNKILKERYTELCDYCGFSFDYLKDLFPMDQLPAIDTVTDLSKELTASETDKIKKVIKKIKKRYPQFIPKVCLLPLQANIPVSLMALWMINHCPPTENEKQQDKEWYVLLLINTLSNKSAISYGYHADIFLPDESIKQLVISLNKSIRKNPKAQSIIELLNNYIPILDVSKRSVKSKFKKYNKKN